MQDISLHLLDIIENSVQAEAKLIRLKIIVGRIDNKLTIEVIDDGIGMDKETMLNAQQPFFTTKVSRKKKIGLGIPLFKQNAEHCDGSFELTSKPHHGTTLKAVFRLDHLDRIPLGNVTDTVLTCILGHPEVDYHIDYRMETLEEEKSFLFDTSEIRKELDGIPLNYPDVIGFIREMLTEGFAGVYDEQY